MIISTFYHYLLLFWKQGTHLLSSVVGWVDFLFGWPKSREYSSNQQVKWTKTLYPVPHLGRDSAWFQTPCLQITTRTTTWNLPGPSGTQDCIHVVNLSYPSPLFCGGWYWCNSQSETKNSLSHFILLGMLPTRSILHFS